MARLLLDTHTLIWWLAGDPELPESARALIADESNAVHVSAASAWEISTKVRIGKLPSAASLVHTLHEQLARQGFSETDITTDHAVRAGSLPGPHRDPVDRMLAAQAQAENFVVVSNDPIFDRFGVVRAW
jgi:PIN domain nuclease of toxin-antitoxin system